MATDMVAASTDTMDPTVLAPAAGDPRTSASVRNPMGNLTNRSRWLWNRLQEVIGSVLPIGGLFPVAASVSGNTFTIVGHGLGANDPVRFFSIGGSVPAPLVTGTTYHVKAVATDTFTVSATPGGTVITLTNVGSGAIYGAKVPSTSIYFTVAAYVGASFTIAAGSIQVFLDLLADKAAKLDATTNLFTGELDVRGALVVGGNVTTAGALNSATLETSGAAQFGSGVSLGTFDVQGNAIFESAIVPTGDAARWKDRTSQIPSNSVTFTVDVTKDLWWGVTMAPAGGTLTITVDSVTKPPVAGNKIWICLYGLAGNGVSIVRSDASQMALALDGGTPTANNFACFYLEFLDKWRVKMVDGYGSTSNGTKIAFMKG